MTVEEYLAFEEKSFVRHSLRDGLVVAMADESYQHNILTVNVMSELRSRLRVDDFRVVGCGLKVKIPRAMRYYYTDVMVISGTPAFEVPDAQQAVLLNPRLLVEVLSDSTEAFDRGDKFTDYREIESLRDYVLVSQHVPRVEAYHRQDDGTWRFQPAAGLVSAVRVESLGIELPLAEIYAGVTFPPPAADAVE